jgi:hypothetical protein
MKRSILSILLVLPVLAHAQSGGNEPRKPEQTSAASNSASFSVRNAANTLSAGATTETTPTTARQQAPPRESNQDSTARDEAREVVLTSEICTYSRYTYTYTCR